MSMQLFGATRPSKRRNRVYLDWASAAPVSKKAQEVFMDALHEYGNPSSPHAEGLRAHMILEDARQVIAHLAEVKKENVIFTSGATEANAIAIQGHVRALQNQGRALADMHLLYLPTSHASVVDTMQALAEEGVRVEALELLEGDINYEKLKKQICSQTIMVSMDLVCGETGTHYRPRGVRRVLDAARPEGTFINGQRILLHVDASQASFSESIEHTRSGADLMTLDAQKVGGVRGIGALIRSNTLLPLKGIMQGGGQEKGIRPGTENPALATAFALALQEVEEGREAFGDRAREARASLVDTLTTAFPDMMVNAGAATVPHILNVSFPGRDTDYAVMLLSQAGYAVATKSACETNAEGSRVVLALTGDEARALSTLRISWGPTTHASDLSNFAKELIKTIHFLDANAL